tara:strand:+ start:3583 stop:4371 length:789 start_codon:yes stop_codon:yes gene_type:complete
MKNIIISGCSISTDSTSLDSGESQNSSEKQYKSYPFFINTHGSFNVHNMSQSALDNGTIYRNLISGVTELLQKGISVNDIFVIVQWSGIDRHSMYSDKHKKWLLSTQTIVQGDDKIWEEYFQNEHTDEMSLNNTLENIRKAQDFLSYHNIKYTMFTGWNIFDDELDLTTYGIDPLKFWFYEAEHWNSFELSIIKDKDCPYPSTEYDSPPIKKYGGLAEWVRKNLDEKIWTRNNVGHIHDDRHPSNEAQEAFCEKIIINLIKI